MTRKLSLAIAAGMLLLGSAASAETLRIGLADDPDVLDPHQSRTFVGRIVYTALCDKLIHHDPELISAPQLVTELHWSAVRKANPIKLRHGGNFPADEQFDVTPSQYHTPRTTTRSESQAQI